MTEATEKVEIQSTAKKISITAGESQPVNDFLNRCIVGKFQCQADETPSLNDVRRSACNSWKLVIQVKVYAMHDGYFMFELQYKVVAEHVLTGKWVWRKMKWGLNGRNERQAAGRQR